MEDLVKLAEQLNLDCQMRTKPALYLAGNALGARALANEAKAGKEISIRADYLKRTDLIARYGMDRPTGIWSDAPTSANPAQLTTSLVQAALSRKAQIVSPVETTDIAQLPLNIALATGKGKGKVFTAGHAVFAPATNICRR